MSGLRSSRNLLAPPMLIRAGNPDLFLSGGDPGVKSFPMVPHTRLYKAQKPGNNVTMEEFNRDNATFDPRPQKVSICYQKYCQSKSFHKCEKRLMFDVPR